MRDSGTKFKLSPLDQSCYETRIQTSSAEMFLVMTMLEIIADNIFKIQDSLYYASDKWKDVFVITFHQQEAQSDSDATKERGFFLLRSWRKIVTETKANN